ncbi:MAG: Radical SAM domain protein [Candidatus Ozemobacter sibiricus]|jgi:radical SAM superfamily enzyme YgiQ (UPF0313 family)|uniref:Radical SAM domain protein n=1 Tax=Candidatus Ozemobacter sibiricus TaxID=2268124 RepID=A0A367ZTP7_9BACT|nr:MAG: Radical SAM domain protein [Candidatus Ozemobacter sibiricus]
MKILLVNPPSRSPQPVIPLGLAYLAAALEAAGERVQVLDAWAERFSLPDLERWLARHGPWGLIGVTIMAPTWEVGRETVQAIRRQVPGGAIIIGGTYPSALPEDAMAACAEIDFAAIGEGDQLIVDLVRSLRTGTPALSAIPGLVYRTPTGIRRNPGRGLVRHLDHLPMLAWHLFPLKRYIPHPPYRLLRSFATLITSRGCPFHCIYCTKAVSGSDFRVQGVPRILEELRHLSRTYGIKQVHFYDDDFPRPRHRLLEFCRTLRQSGLPLLWSCVARVDSVDEEVVREMKAAGCWLIAFGVESGSQAILDRALKGYTLAQVRRAFAVTRQAGLQTLGYFMAGLPGETRETLEQTVRLSLELDPDYVSWSITALYPGSRLHEQAREQWSSHPGGPGHLPRFGVSSQSPYAHGHVALLEENLPAAEIQAAVAAAYRRFYLRPGYLLRFPSKWQTLTQALSFFKAGGDFLRWVWSRG